MEGGSCWGEFGGIVPMLICNVGRNSLWFVLGMAKYSTLRSKKLEFWSWESLSDGTLRCRKEKGLLSTLAVGCGKKESSIAF